MGMDGLYDCDDSVMTMMMMMMTKTTKTTTKTIEDAPDASVSQRLTYFLTSYSCMLSRRMYFCLVGRDSTVDLAMNILEHCVANRDH